MTFEEEVKFFLSDSQVLITPFYDGVHASMIYTKNGMMKSKGTVDQIIHKLCLEFGSTLKGRQKASRKMLKIKKNPPIVISERLGIVGMPLPCVRYKENAWVFDLNFDTYCNDTFSELRFNENLKFHVNLSKAAVEERLSKAHKLDYRIKSKSFPYIQQLSFY